MMLNYDNETYNGHFKPTSLYDFLNNQFINEIMPCAGQPEIEQTTDSLDKEIASLEAEIAQKKELIREWKESKLELLTAVKASLDAEIASLGIDSSKGTAYTKKPQNSQTTVKGQ